MGAAGRSNPDRRYPPSLRPGDRAPHPFATLLRSVLIGPSERNRRFKLDDLRCCRISYLARCAGAPACQPVTLKLSFAGTGHSTFALAPRPMLLWLAFPGHKP